MLSSTELQNLYEIGNLGISGMGLLPEFDTRYFSGCICTIRTQIFLHNTYQGICYSCLSQLVKDLQSLTSF